MSRTSNRGTEKYDRKNHCSILQIDHRPGDSDRSLQCFHRRKRERKKQHPGGHRNSLRSRIRKGRRRIHPKTRRAAGNSKALQIRFRQTNQASHLFRSAVRGSEVLRIYEKCLGKAQTSLVVQERKADLCKQDRRDQGTSNIDEKQGAVHSRIETGNPRRKQPGDSSLGCFEKFAFDASEGVLYVLFAAVLALLPTSPKCLAIDNVDKALNPRIVKELTRLLCRWLTIESQERQFFVTAHNPAVLDGLDIGDDRVRLFAVDRNNLGHTTVNRIQPDERLLNLSREKGWPLSRLWVMGHLGGVPNV